MKQYLKRLFIYSTSFTYSNLSRLFIRLFVGVLFIRFGIRHILFFNNIVDAYPSMFGMSNTTCLVVLIIVELLGGLMLMLGLLSRITSTLSILAMIYAAKSILDIDRYHFINDIADLDAMDPVYIPILLIGIFLYLILSGPGKISLDYIISLVMVSESNEPADDNLLQDA
ncbi:MAG: DoxX family protein [Muribaculaceae bacterium]|nr:DoxX family protein [Muribaculaceae bacterium]